MGRHPATPHHPRRLTQVREPPVGARPHEGDVDPGSAQRRSGRQAHEVQGLPDRVRVRSRVRGGRVRNRLRHVHRLARVDPPRHARLDGAAIDLGDIVVDRVRVRGHRPPPLLRALEGATLGRERPPLQVREGGLVGVDIADSRAALDGHVADRHALVHGHALDRLADVLVRVADPAPHTQPRDDLEDDVLGVDARPQFTRDRDPAHLERSDRQALGSEHVAHLRGADPEGHRPEGAVRGRVAVPARYGHARLREAQFRRGRRRRAASGPASARCGRPWRRCAPGRPRRPRVAAACRRPAEWSPRGSGAGR